MIVTKIINITLDGASAIYDAYINVPWKITEIRTKQMSITSTAAVAGFPVIVYSSLIGNETHGLVWSDLDVTFSAPDTTYRFRAPQDIQGVYQFQLNSTDNKPYLGNNGDVLSIVLEFDECTDINFPCRGHMGLP